MLLCVIGDVDPEQVTAIARKMLGIENKSVAQKLPLPRETMTGGQTREEAMEVAMPMFNLAFKCEPLDKGDEAIRLEMVADLAAEALFGESSQLYLQLYEQGLIDSSFGGGFETVDGCAMLLCSGDSNDPEAVKQALLARAAQLSDEGLSDEDFLRLKRSALGRRIRGLDSFDSTCFRVCAYHFSDFAYFRFPEIYRSIEKQEIQAFLRRVVTDERSALSIIRPRKGN